MLKKYIFFVIAIIVSLVLILLLSRQPQSEDLFVIRIADLPVVHALPLYVALEKGYFEEENIRIERIPMEAPNLIIDALLSGRVDMVSPSGAMGIAGVVSTKMPGEIQIYAATGGNHETPNESFLIPVNSNIESLADLRDKKVGILPGIQWRTLAQHVLTLSGLDENEIVLVELGPGLQPGALASGQIDALLATEPMAAIVQARGIGKVLEAGPMSNRVANPFYAGAGLVRSEFRQEHPQEFDAVMRAMRRAISDIRQDPDAHRQYLTGYTSLEQDLIPIAPILIYKLYDEFTESDIVAIEAFHQIFYDYDVVDEPIDTRAMILDS